MREVVDTPLGELILVASSRGLVRVGLPGADLADIADISDTDVEPPRDRATLLTAATQLTEYFAAERQEFTVPLDLPAAQRFRARAHRGLLDIAYGQTESYSALAARLGNPRAVRAVGSACATNPLPIIVPCHRVLRNDGSLGGYAGGLEMKQYLLELERASLARS